MSQYPNSPDLGNQSQSGDSTFENVWVFGKFKYCLNEYFHSNFSMKKTCAYLWLAGKEYFPKNYMKRIRNG